jgi:fatty acid desaturase
MTSAIAEVDLERESRLLRDAVSRIPREWFRASEWIVLVQGLGDLAVLAAGAAVCLACESPWVRVPVWVLMAGRIHALGVLMHDLVHIASLAHRPARRLLLDLVICYPALINMDYYGLAHRIHHAESNLPDRDPYFVPLHQRHPVAYAVYVVVGSVMLVAALVVRLVLWPLTAVSPRLRHLYVKYLSQLGANPDPERPERYQMGERIWIWGLGPAVFWGTIASVLTAFRLWEPFAYAYGIPMLLASILGQVRLACDHIYTEALGSSIVEQVAGATSVEAPWWQQVVMGAHGTSYHALHHLVPTLPNYRLAPAHKILLDSGSTVYARTVYRGYGAVIAQLLRAQWAWTRDRRLARAAATAAASAATAR